MDAYYVGRGSSRRRSSGEMSTKVELRLTSGRVGRKESVDKGLIYSLEEGCGLPVVHQTHPWAGKNISALRDRLPSASSFVLSSRTEYCVA